MAKPAPQFKVPSPLRLHRLTLGLTLYDVAKAAGRSEAYVSYAERGRATNPGDVAALEKAVTRLAARLGKKNAVPTGNAIPPTAADLDAAVTLLSQERS